MEAYRGPILFRCDGTEELGWEPLYQCLSLAAAMQRRRRGTHFFSYLDPLSLAQTIHRGNNEWIAAEEPLGTSKDLDETIRQIRRLNAAAIVVAGKHLDTNYLQELRRTGTLVVVFDSTGTPYPVDILVNPLLSPTRKLYRPAVGTQLLIGHRFALCRGVFRRQRTIRAMEPAQPFRALVAMGDDDPQGQALERTRQLLEIPAVSKVSIVTRSHHPRYEEMKDLAAESNSRVEIITEVKELMTRLVRVHFALTAGDMWSLELCVVGIPQLILAQTERHARNGKRMDEECIATYLGDAAQVSFEELRSAVELLLTDEKERKGMTRCARNMIDGRGPDRIVNGMEIILHTPSRKRAALANIPALRAAA